jgi:transcriptional regulator with XRE-family HTH domain
VPAARKVNCQASACCLNALVMASSSRLARTSSRTALGRSARDLRRRVGTEIRRLRLDANLSQRSVASAAEIDHGYLSQIEAGTREASIGVLLAIGDVLGADLQVRLYPTTGPRIRDRIQAAMVEALFVAVHPRWKRHAEVRVHRPARGFIDVVLADSAAGLVVATEAQSEIRRLEQQLRWAHDKADSLPSAAVWPALAPVGVAPPTVSRLLVLRSSRSMRELALTFSATLASAYPASTAEIYRALTTSDTPWPGAGIIWVVIEGGRGRILERPPRGVGVGR